MAATGKTPILLYGSTTPTNTPVAGNLTNSSDGCEIAINVADKNLFFKDTTNTVNTVPIRQSSASSNGWLSSTDWSTFNGKASAFTYTSTYIPYGQGTTTPTQSANLTFDGSLLNVVGQTKVSSLANSGGSYFNYTAAGVDSRSWRLTNDALLYGDFQIQQSTTQTGSTYETKLYFDPYNSNVTVSLGNLVIGTSGKGIDFSATAGTGTSELLADYEEGTWTPTQGAGLTVVGTFSSAGTYTKVGRQVTVSGYVAGTTSVAVGGIAAICGGLPYTASNSAVGSVGGYPSSAISACFTSSTTIYSYASVLATGLIAFTVSYFV